MISLSAEVELLTNLKFSLLIIFIAEVTFLIRFSAEVKLLIGFSDAYAAPTKLTVTFGFIFPEKGGD